ncbi:Dephospho-CoA kinase [Acidisarcina polymorpha]|uniref:Dephospho-CoA kinase n=1 Tax=Acidisarcina polymorpha TaxID=2211140 RepID=A0A2Z5G129_9BACT|nr:dephospho-CoA kinase [Acidisarcina polymorpha]AXC12838.1 Dephospho-CoA kinase [Acidisarcina polymorpha]
MEKQGLRVGLTGGLGSGKSTVGRMFADLGVAVIDADEVGRRLMQPGQPVYDAIVQQFGSGVVREDGSLDRRALAQLAFQRGRVEELNHIVHPAVVAAQEQWMGDLFAADPRQIAMIESALIFEAGRSGFVAGWRDRFDRIILVTAPEEVKVRRYVERSHDGDPEALAADARKRLAAQIPDADKIAHCDWVIDNSGDIKVTGAAVAKIYAALRAEAAELATL